MEALCCAISRSLRHPYAISTAGSGPAERRRATLGGPARKGMTMKEYKLTKAQEMCLRNQAITTGQPGPVLHDFQVLLDFLGSQGVESVGKYNLLPLKYIGELDDRLSRPIHLEMKRPQLR